MVEPQYTARTKALGIALAIAWTVFLLALAWPHWRYVATVQLAPERASSAAAHAGGDDLDGVHDAGKVKNRLHR